MVTAHQQFQESCTPRTPERWAYVDRVAMHALSQLARGRFEDFESIVTEAQEAGHIDSVSTAILRAKLVTSPLPAYVDNVVKGTDIAADTMLKPMIRALRSVYYFASLDGRVKEDMRAAYNYIRSGRTFIFEGSTSCGPA